MWESIASDIDVRNLVLRAWLEPRSASIAAASPDPKDEEQHLWHFATSSNSLISTPGNADLHHIAGFWAGTMPFFPDGAVTNAISESLAVKKPGHFYLA